MSQQFKKTRSKKLDASPKKQQQKLNYDMQREIEDAFSFYDPKKTKLINREQLKCILGNIIT